MDFTSFLHVLRRRWVAIVLCLAAGVAGALTLTASTAKLYQASSRVVVNIPPGGSVAQGAEGLRLTSELLPTYAEIATSRKVAAKVRSALALPESDEQVRATLGATPVPKTLLIDVTAKDADPVRARSIADAAALALSEAVAELERERTAGSAITVTQLDQALLPRTPVAPRPTYNLVLGILLGGLIGTLFALLHDALDRSIKTSVQSEAASGAPVLGLVPRLRRGHRGVLSPQDQMQEAGEAYRTLRTSVRFLHPDDQLRTLVITSAGAGEGKTTTVVNLATSIAQGGERVVVVDADLRRASVAEVLGLEGSVGLSSVIARQVSLPDAVQRWNDLFAVLPAGQLPPNPSELVGSQRMVAVLEELLAEYDVVLLDTPPVLPVTDAVALATQADGVLLVARAGRTQRQNLAEARRRLDGVGAQVVGCVLNAASTGQAQGYYATYRPLPAHAETP